MQILTLDKNVYNYYTRNVKGNKFLEELEVRKKLTRNYHLSIKLKFGSQELCQYGNLTIMVKKGKVLWIKNNKNLDSSWFILDKEKYNQLNEELKIDIQTGYEGDILKINTPEEKITFWTKMKRLWK